MPRDHVVKVGDDWVDGMLVGKAAALAEWSIRKEIDDPEFERLIGRLQQKRYWANLDPETKARIRSYREQWKEENREQYRAAVRNAKRRGRADGARWYENEKCRKREKFKKNDTQRMRKEVYTCVVCGAQWCIARGRIPSRRPKYCSQPCRSKANYERGKTRGAPWARRDKQAARAGVCSGCGGPTSRAGGRCAQCAGGKRGGLVSNG